MRNFFYGFLIILTAVLVTKTGASGKSSPSPATNTATKTGNCTAVAQTPVRSSTEIVSDGRFSCGLLGVDDVWMTVTMQKKAGSDWTTVATAAFHGVGSATSNATSNTSRTRGVHAVCATGTFRTAVKVAGGSTKAADYLSAPVTDPCA